ncbi:MAG: chromosomal replication initiator protein DnaA [Anaerolineaceae bacterium]|nr:chromosomal replication initiator protein DnaA [Anaerolineaceae bacterium]
MKAHQAWQAVKAQLKMELSKAQYDTWVKQSEFLSFEESNALFTLSARNAFACDWLNDRLKSTIANKLTGLMASPVQVIFKLASAEVEAPETENKTAAEENQPAPSLNVEPTQAAPLDSHLNPRYRFDNFIVGSCNRLAQAASLAVAGAPATAYNPLLIYSGVGLGKTHLLHAIGNEIVKTGQKVLYVTAEEFTNDVVDAILRKNQTAFRDVRGKYREVDVLLVDDVQFLAGKERTQEEFFHTFNTLHHEGKQIILTSDRPPKEMSTLEERMRSRFTWGLIVDMQAPDYETRYAILASKAGQEKRKVPAEIMELIAREASNNIRELEGAWNRCMAFADLSGSPLTMELVENALADFLPARQERSPSEIVTAVSHFFGINRADLTGKCRSKEIVLPRQVAMYLLREENGVSLPRIGQELGGRDHTTVMYACEKVAELMERDDKLRRQVSQLREQLYRA